MHPTVVTLLSRQEKHLQLYLSPLLVRIFEEKSREAKNLASALLLQLLRSWWQCRRLGAGFVESRIVLVLDERFHEDEARFRLVRRYLQTKKERRKN